MILVLGYFKRGNLGDELFATIWDHVLAKAGFPYTIMSFEDDISIVDFSHIDTIVLAGGDLINEYFMKKLRQVLKLLHPRKVPVYGISLGIPYSSPLERFFVRSLSYITVRARASLAELQNAVGLSRCMYHPDISVYLPRLYPDPSPRGFLERYKQHPGRLNVGVFLTRTIFASNPKYSEIVRSMGKSLTQIVNELNVEIFFIAFNTNDASTHECDHYIARDVYAHMDPDVGSAVHVIEESFDSEAMWYIFRDELDFNWLMEEAGETQRTYFLPLDAKARPTAFNADHFLDLFRTHLGDPMPDQFVWGNDHYTDFEQFLSDLLQNKTPYPGIPSITSYRSATEKVKDALDKVVAFGLGDPETPRQHHVDNIFTGKTSVNEFMTSRTGTWSNAISVPVAEFLAQLVLLSMTGDASSEFLYGLAQKIMTPSFDARAELGWIAQNTPEESYAEVETPYFALTARTNLKGLHRSGWQYVINKLATYSDPDSDLLMDDYVDRTFHWMHDLYLYTGVIPYQKPWMGFIHHTYETSYSHYSVPELFAKPSFLKSLRTCAGLLCLSQDLANKVRGSLRDHGFESVPVHSLVHPTEFIDNNFTMTKFHGNPERHLIQIGAWLRDSYAIHELDLPPQNPLRLRKAALRGKCMENHFAPDDLTLTVQAPSIGLDATVQLKDGSGDLVDVRDVGTLCPAMCR
ncbi:hypothetical protein HK102_013884, partial [Quaeritorhiza haematococci]